MIVLPGDEVNVRIPRQFSYTKDGKTYATVLGTIENGHFVPYEFVYTPKLGDVVVGRVIAEKKRVAYIVDLGAYKTAVIMTRGLPVRIKIGDVVMGKLEQSDEILSNVRVLRGGALIKIHPSKIARVIGTNGSMVKIIKEKTETSIYVGYNGYIYVAGKNVSKAIKAIYTIEKRAHIHGLTDFISKMLEGGKNES
ncbi:MAG: hypothetical protein GXN92_00985 [Candidatus Micrarchaeota archaeon]|nr:hypothetical protein [Candidatus Micrarchaeota archaeon]